jgi:hypothetical protein
MTVFNIKNGTSGENLVDSFVDKLREVAAERDIKLPKKMGVGGKLGEQVYVLHNRIVVRELVREIGKDFDGMQMI